MAERLRFRSSRPPALERPVSAARRATRWALAAGAVAAILYFSPIGPSRGDDPRGRFTARRPDFTRLRDMIASESSLMSIGVDNVGEFWLFDGKWTASGQRFVAYSRPEMLEAAGLSAKRYDAYLSLLGRVGAYRVARQSTLGGSLRGMVFLFRDSQGGGPAVDIVFSQRQPEPLLSWNAARSESRPAYAKLDDGWYVEFHR